jgi:hypothetical protein
MASITTLPLYLHYGVVSDVTDWELGVVVRFTTKTKYFNSQELQGYPVKRPQG